VRGGQRGSSTCACLLSIRLRRGLQFIQIEHIDYHYIVLAIFVGQAITSIINSKRRSPNSRQWCKWQLLRC